MHCSQSTLLYNDSGMTSKPTVNPAPRILPPGFAQAPSASTRLRRITRLSKAFLNSLREQKMILVALLALTGIVIHLFLRFAIGTAPTISRMPLLVILVLGGAPLIYDLARKALRREFGSDLLAGISIVTSVLLGEYLAGSIVVLMLSGGQALEAYAVRRASSVLNALAKRMPSVAHRKQDAILTDLPLDQISAGDTLVVFPHEICPVDGTVVEGHGVMDESYLTGEPFRISKAPGVAVISGAVNGDSALSIPAMQKSWRQFVLPSEIAPACVASATGWARSTLPLRSPLRWWPGS
jgi:cation transport ATPase